jgi:hypothetical protein
MMEFGKYIKLNSSDVKRLKKDKPNLKAVGHIEFDMLKSLDINIEPLTNRVDIALDTSAVDFDLSFMRGYLKGIDRENTCYEVRGFIEQNGTIKLEIY